MSVSLIWAQSVDGVIGDGVSMPWHVREDLRHFQSMTAGGVVVMGRGTWESLPAAFRPLPGRENVVISSREPGVWSQGARVVDSVEHACRDGVGGDGQCAASQARPLWIVGGGQVYAETIDRADRLVVTFIDTKLVDVFASRTVYAPAIDESVFTCVDDSGWLVSSTGSLTEEVAQKIAPREYGRLRYRFRDYRRSTRRVVDNRGGTKADPDYVV